LEITILAGGRGHSMMPPTMMIATTTINPIHLFLFMFGLPRLPETRG
jgi:hypothetical protein